MKEATENLWLKIKFWTKLTITVLVIIYIVSFIAENAGTQARFWYWPYHTYSVSILLLAAFSFVAGIIVWFLARTTFKTIRQFQSMRSRSRTQRLEREVEDMKAKSVMLQTKPPAEEPPPSGESREPGP